MPSSAPGTDDRPPIVASENTSTESAGWKAFVPTPLSESTCSAPASPAIAPASTNPPSETQRLGTLIASAALRLSRVAMRSRPLRARRTPRTANTTQARMPSVSQ